jgi:hypothetical protein
MPANDERVSLGWHCVLREREPEQIGVAPLDAVSGAISLGTRVASLGRPPSIPAPALMDVISPMMAELWNWDAFNFNPRKNNGRQIDLIFAGTIND